MEMDYNKHSLSLLSCSKQSCKKYLTAKDGCGEVLDTGDSGGQASYNADNPIKKGGVGGHSQDGCVMAAGLLTLDHHSKTHAEEVSPPQGSHHSLTQKSGDKKFFFKLLNFCE